MGLPKSTTQKSQQKIPTMTNLCIINHELGYTSPIYILLLSKLLLLILYVYIYILYVYTYMCVCVYLCVCIYIMYIYALPTACSSDWHRFFLAIRALCKRQSSATSKTHTGSILFKENQRGMTYPSFHAPLTGSQFYRILWQLECGDGIGGAN